MTDVLDRVAELLEQEGSPAFLAGVQDWRHSSCVDPEHYPSKRIAPNWEGPGTLCHSCSVCRPEQRAPIGDWDVWLYLAGRGSGKTRSAAELVAEALALNFRWRIAIVAPTYADARDTCVEGESGILSVFDRWGWTEGREYIWNRSLGELIVASTKSRIKLFSAEKPARLRGPQHHCFPAGTIVRTPKGGVPIETLSPGSEVLTRFGMGLVLDARNRAASTVVVHHSGGSLRCTPDHLILTVEHGWREARLIQPGDTVVTWLEESGRPTLAVTSTGMSTVGCSTATDTCGSRRTDPLLADAIFTTWTTTRPTTTWKISRYSPAKSTCGTTTRSEGGGRLERLLARIAKSPTRSRATVARGLSGAQTANGRWGRERDDSSRESVGCAESRSEREAGTSVVRDVSISDEATVYNIQVGPDPEYYANDIVVHNCAWVDELAQVVRDAPDAWDMLLFGLRLGRRPQVVATTTPLPVQVIKDLMVDPTCAVTRGKTMDNAANLAPPAMRALQRKYAGTRLGRQELDAEILDDVPTALWRRDWIEAKRITVDWTAKWAEEDPEITRPAAAAILQHLAGLGIHLARIVVGLDPAVESKEGNDQSGIIVAGRATNRRFYVLADYTLRDVPDKVMTKVIQAVDDWQANSVIIEVNNGGQYIPAMLRATCTITGHPFIDAQTVRAKAGQTKRVRAEPVSALYGQGQVHHVGTHVHLEDCLCVWEPSKPESPDRMDALVYGVLHLEGGGETVIANTSKIPRIPRHQMGRAGGALGALARRR